LYFYDSSGKHVKDPHGDILIATGGVGSGDRAMHYSELFVGTEEERSKQSYEAKQQRLQDLFLKLHPEWSD
jgi:hypothetical protein